MYNFAKAGRQKASSAGASVSTDDIAKAVDVMQTQLVGLYSAMPCILPDTGGHVRYGAPHGMALKMSELTTAEYREGISSLPPEIQLEKIQKLVEERKQASKMVRLVFTSLIPKPLTTFGMVFRQGMKRKVRRLV
jgi:hypothetical protein